MKKIIVSLVLMALLLVGCGQSSVKEGSYNEAFNTLLDELLVDIMDPSNHAINFFFRDPEAFGITSELYEISFIEEDVYKDDIEESKALIKKLEGFKDNQLSPQQVLDKKVVLESLRNSVAMAPYYDYEYGGSMIGPQRSLMASFASELEAYTFRTKHDIEAYLNLIKTFPLSVDKSIEFELKRIENKVGFGQEEIDEILRVYKDTATEMKKDNYFLLGHFDKAMDKATYISDEDKIAYKAQHRDLVKHNLAAGYEAVIASLSDVNAEPTTGLANKPNGKAYYELLLRQSSGRDYSISKIEDFLEELLMQSYMTFMSLGESNLNKYMDMMIKDEYGDFESGEELLAMIESRYTEDLPSIPKPNYELRKVDASMEKSAAPAFYFVPSIDYKDDEKQVIYINGNFNNKLYQTYAHEGMPGHMYQYSYFMGIEGMHPVRRLIGESSNSEGWATYAENIATRYVHDEGFLGFKEAMDNLQNVVLVKADIGVNYYGWTLQEFTDYMLKYFELDANDKALKDTYIQLANTPGVIATYNLSSMYISDLKLMVMQELDDRYDEVEFHRAFLNVGSASFDIIEYELKKFIASERVK
jgi:uncharacterized protein (DUF885 family)